MRPNRITHLPVSKMYGAISEQFAAITASLRKGRMTR